MKCSDLKVLVNRMDEIFKEHPDVKIKRVFISDKYLVLGETDKIYEVKHPDRV